MPVMFNSRILASVKTSRIYIDNAKIKLAIIISILLIFSTQERFSANVPLVPKILVMAALMVIQKNIQSLRRKASKVGMVSVE